MKKRYTIPIIGISTLMFLSVALYALKIVKDSNGLDNISDSISYLIAEFSGSNKNSNEQEAGEQGEMYNFLSQNNAPKNSVISRSVETKTGYEGLSTEYEQKCYNLIKSNCNQISDNEYKPGLYLISPITISGCKLSSTQIKKILYAIQNDNPDIFWISGTFSYQYTGNKTTLKLNSILKKDEQKAATKKLEQKVSEILSKISSSSSEYEIELFIHDYIIKNCKYTESSKISSNNPKIFTSYGCLIDGSAVCEGFSKATQLLLNHSGIKCTTITGAKKDESHMWNIVKINGNWYHLDVTWDATGALQQYNYFNVSDNLIKKDHIINEELSRTIKFEEDKRYNFKLPVCNSMFENFYEKNAVKINFFDSNSTDSVVNALVKNASKKGKYFYLKITDNSNYENIKKQLFAQQPYKFFEYINSANKKLAKNKISSKQIQYSECAPQKVLTIELSYK